MLDILYSEFSRIRDARDDKKEQIILAKGLVKKALLKFYLDWTAYSNSFHYSYTGAKETLTDYAKLLIDVCAEVYELIPIKLINEVTGISTKIRSILDEIRILNQDYSFEDLVREADECARDAFQIYNTFDDYFN
jgi:hypothetical protein